MTVTSVVTGTDVVVSGSRVLAALGVSVDDALLTVCPCNARNERDWLHATPTRKPWYLEPFLRTLAARDSTPQGGVAVTVILGRKVTPD